MASETEIERLVVRLTGDNTGYTDMLKGAIAATKQAEDVMQRAAQITRSVETATERYTREVEELKELLDAQAISQDTYTRAVNQSKAALDAATGVTARQNDLMAKGRAVANSLLTPMDKYNQNLQELQGLLSEGAIDQNTYTRAVEQAKVALDSATGATAKHNDLLARGRAVTEALITPAQQYERKVADLNELHKAGVITTATYTLAVDKAKRAYYDTTTAAHNAAEEEKRLNYQFQRGEEIARQLEKPIDKYNRELKELNGLLKDGAINQQQHYQMVKRAAAELKAAGNEASRFGQRMAAAGGNLRGFGTSMSLFVTAPLTMMGYMAQQKSTEFQSAMAKVAGIGGASAESLAGFRAEIMQLGPALGKSPKELADGLQFIVGAGLEGKTAMEALTASAKASAAGLGETQGVADAITSAMNVYGHNTLSASQATDILTQAVIEGKAEAASFAPQLGQVLPIANQLGIDFGEAAGSIAFFTKSTGNASLATTTYSNVLSQLLRMGPEADKTLAKVGLSGEALRKSIADRGVVTTLNDLRKRLDAANIPVNKLFSDVQALNGVLQMTGPGAQQAADTIAAVGNSAGATDKALAAIEQTAGHGMARAMAEMEVQLIELGDIVAPIMMQFLDLTEMLIAKWKELSPETKKVIVVVAAIAAAIGPILGGLGMAVAVIGGAVTAFGALGAALPVIAVVGAALTGLIAMGAAVGAFFAYFEGARDIIVELGTAVWEMASGAVAAVVREWKSAFLPVIQEVADLIETHLVPALRDAWDSITAQLGPSVSRLSVDLLPMVTKAFEIWAEAVRFLWTNGIKALTTAIRVLTPVIGNILKGAVDKAHAGITAFNAVVRVAIGLVDGLWTAATRVSPKLALIAAAAGGGSAPTRTKVSLPSLPETPQKAVEKATETATTGAAAAQEQATVINTELAESIRKAQEEAEIQAATFGMLSYEADIYRLKLKGASEEELQSIRTAGQALEAKKKAKEESDKAAKAVEQEKKRLQDLAKTITESVKTPMEKMADKRREMDDLLAKNLITLDTYNKALKEAEEQAQKDYTADFKVTGVDAVAAGSAEAVARLQEFMIGKTAMPRSIASRMQTVQLAQAPVEAPRPSRTPVEAQRPSGASNDSLAIVAKGISRLVEIEESKSDNAVVLAPMGIR